MQDPIEIIVEAERLAAAGNLDAAAKLAHVVLASNPQVALALNVLGQIAARAGNAQAAVTLWETAVRAGPSVPQPWVALGEAMFHQGQLPRAAECFREALARNPQLHPVRVNYGIVLQQLKRHEEAIDQFRRALVAEPSNAETAVALATSLHELDRTFQAIDVLTDAAKKHPRNVKILSNLGVLYEKSDQLEDAIAWYGRALEVAPDDPTSLFNRGSSLIALLRLDEAKRDWEAAMQLRPNDAVTQSNLAILELMQGNYPRGFDLFESRWAVRHKKFPIPAPQWEGEPLAGKHLMLYVEQGLGDMLQFCRFVPVLKQKYGCRITLAALPTLHGLLRSLQGADAIVDIHPPYPQVDFQGSLLSVPRLLGTTLQSIPVNVPYLRADAAKATHWKDRFTKLGAGPRIGLFWQGTQVDPNRAIHLPDLSVLWQANPNLRFISLQKGPGEEEIGKFALPILPVGHELLDFSDTAAVLECLDLLITIDTSISHAAGAMGKKAWVLLPYRPDWRWMLARSDSPWYPTLRLYRQEQRKVWTGAIKRIAEDLRKFAL
jgi:tetratricopeptide (TPR) repeat protein